MTAAGFRFGARRRARRPSLTPMIDVVFLLLVFFMLAARFGSQGGMELALAGPGGGAAWQGPPRLVEIAPGAVRLNGAPVTEAALVPALRELMAAPDQPVVLRPLPGTDTARLVAVMAGLQAAGLTRLALVD